MRPTPRIVWFVVAALVTGLLATALRAERIAGDLAQASLVFDVDVPHQALAEMSAADIERTWRVRLREYGVEAAAAPSAAEDVAGVRVTVIGAGAAQEVGVHAALTSSARLEMAWVLDGNPAMATWYQAVDARELPGLPPDVEARPDAWAHERTGKEFFDSYLRAHSTDALDRAVAILHEHHPLPRGQRVVYERVIPMPVADEDRDVDVRPYYRTYVIDDDVILTDQHIADAAVSYDPDTLRPEVMVVFTDEGARRFGDATAANVGRKLAILLDERVASAPTVQGAMYGGRTTITMGDTDPDAMERDARALAAALGSSLRLPAGLEAKLVATHERPTAIMWTLRVLAAVLGGVLAVMAAAVAGRRRWFAPAPSLAPGTARWAALAIPVLVTVLVPAVLWYAAGAILLPGINEVELENLIRDPSHAARSQLGIFAIGLVPVTSAFVLTELFAILVEMLVPARRGRRLGTPNDRRALERGAWVLVALLALVQSYFIAVYLESLSARGADVFVGGSHARWLVVASLTTGVMVQIVAADLVSRQGLCNGYLVLLASGAGVDLFSLLVPGVDPRVLDPQRPSTMLLAAIAAVAAAATVASTRARSGESGPRLPYTGVVPASLVRGGLGLFAIAGLWSPWIAEQLVRAQPWTPAFELAATAPITGLIFWSTKPRGWTAPGVVATFAFLAVLVLVPFTIAAPFRLVAPLAEGVLLGAVAAELWVGVRARVRIPDAVSVLVVHDVERADRAADRLAAAGIPFAVLGVRARAALRFIGAFAPIAVRVPAARAADAAALVDETAAAAATPSLESRAS